MAQWESQSSVPVRVVAAFQCRGISELPSESTCSAWGNWPAKRQANAGGARNPQADERPHQTPVSQMRSRLACERSGRRWKKTNGNTTMARARSKGKLSLLEKQGQSGRGWSQGCLLVHLVPSGILPGEPQQKILPLRSLLSLIARVTTNGPGVRSERRCQMDAGRAMFRSLKWLTNPMRTSRSGRWREQLSPQSQRCALPEPKPSLIGSERARWPRSTAERLPAMAPEPGKTRSLLETDAFSRFPRTEHRPGGPQTEVSTRVKCSSMRWTPERLDAVPALRTTAL